MRSRETRGRQREFINVVATIHLVCHSQAKGSGRSPRGLWGDSSQGCGYSRAIAVGYIGYNLFNLHSSRITLPAYGLGAGVGRGEDGGGTGVM